MTTPTERAQTPWWEQRGLYAVVPLLWFLFYAATIVLMPLSPNPAVTTPTFRAILTTTVFVGAGVLFSMGQIFGGGCVAQWPRGCSPRPFTLAATASISASFIAMATEVAASPWAGGAFGAQVAIVGASIAVLDISARRQEPRRYDRAATVTGGILVTLGLTLAVAALPTAG